MLEKAEELTGIVLSIFSDRQQYEFGIADDERVLYGPVSEELDREYLSNPSSILLKPVKQRSRFLRSFVVAAHKALTESSKR
jgi:hypothetical protein